MITRRNLLIAMLTLFAMSVTMASPLSAAAGKKAKKAKKAGFKAYDVNDDLRLSPAEYKTMAETQPKKYTGQFRKVDADRDGYISIEEYRRSFAPAKKTKKKKGK